MPKVCLDCGKNTPSNRHSYCGDCSKKRERSRMSRYMIKRYKEDKIFRDLHISYGKQWALNHPFRRWATSVMRNHRQRGFCLIFSIDDVEKMARETSSCRICGVILDYGKKKAKGSYRNSPSLDNKFGARCKMLSLNDVEIICAFCNSAKREMTITEFVNYCKVVVERCNV